MVGGKKETWVEWLLKTGTEEAGGEGHWLGRSDAVDWAAETSLEDSELHVLFRLKRLRGRKEWSKSRRYERGLISEVWKLFMLSGGTREPVSSQPRNTDLSGPVHEAACSEPH